ncbi:IPT/TIG domain-containing protein [Myxococcaceae bacterium GXIMD 01537]
MRPRCTPPWLVLASLFLVLTGCPKPEEEAQTVSALMGPEGGTLTHPAGAVLVVPPGALSAPVSLTLATAPTPNSQALNATPVGPAFLLGPEGLGFARPVQLTLPFDATQVPTQPGVARVFTAPRGSNDFVQLVTSTGDLTVTASTLHFSAFVPAAPLAASALSITTGSPLPSGAVGAPYGPVYLDAIGGTPPYNWLLSWGALPQGITLSTAPDGRGVLQGMPGNPGNHAFSLRVSDSAGQIIEAPFELLVTSASGIAITAVMPPQILIRSGDTLVTLTGVGFAVGSAVTLEGVSLATTFISDTSLAAVVPASMLTTAGTHQLRVSNALIGGGVSPPFPLLVIHAPPTLTGMSPPEVPAGHPTLTVTVQGTNLGAGGQAYLGAVALPTQVRSPTEAVITVNGNLLVNAGTFPLTFVNPAPGGGTSAPLPFRVVTLPSPTVLVAGHGGTSSTLGSIALDDVSVYWTDYNEGTLKKVPINGGAVTLLDAPGKITPPNSVAVGRCNVYWIRVRTVLAGNLLGEVMSMPVTGDTPGRLFSSTWTLGLVRHDSVTNHVYWGRGSDVSDMIYRAPDSGGVAVETLGTTWIQDFELDDTSLYVLSRGTGGGRFLDGGVLRVGKDGTGGGWLARSLIEARHLALSSTRVYWTLQSGEILSAAKSGVGGVTTVLSTGAEIHSLAVDANNLYWTTDHDVRMQPHAGGPVTILASAANSLPHALEVDGAFMYWLTRSGQVMRLPKPGGSGGPPATSVCAGNPGQSFPVLLSKTEGYGGVVSDGTYVYWSDGRGSSQGAIFKVPIAGGTTTTLSSGHDQPFTLKLFDGQLYWPDIRRGVLSMPASDPGPGTLRWAGATPTDLAVDASGGWWVSSNTSQLIHNGNVVSTYTNDPPIALALDDTQVYTSRFSTHISRQPKGSSTSVTVVGDDASTASMVTSGGYLYWVTLNSDIKRWPLAGGPLETLVTGQTGTRALVVDNGDLYWLSDGIYPDYGNGRVKFLRAGTATPATLAEGQPSPSGIAVDAQNVYWLNGGTGPTGSPGGVFKLSKSALP